MKSLFVLVSAFFIAAEVNAQQLTTETPLVDKAFTPVSYTHLTLPTNREV